MAIKKDGGLWKDIKFGDRYVSKIYCSKNLVYQRDGKTNGPLHIHFDSTASDPNVTYTIESDTLKTRLANKIKVSTDGVNFWTWKVGYGHTVHAYDIWVYNESDQLSIGEYQYFQFHMGGGNARATVDGNIMSMLNGRTDYPDYCFMNLFDRCNSIRHMALTFPACPAGKCSFKMMFYDCGYLKTVDCNFNPTVFGEEACAYMFYNCPSMTQYPAFNADGFSFTGPKTCYKMFAKTAINYEAEYLPNNMRKMKTLTDYCFSYMFYDARYLHCKVPDGGTMDWLPLKVDHKGVYSHMFDGVFGKLTTSIPRIHLTSSMTEACDSMYLNCYNLISAPIIDPFTPGNNNTCANMFNGCTGLSITCATNKTRTRYKVIKTGDNVNCTDYTDMFKGCWEFDTDEKTVIETRTPLTPNKPYCTFRIKKPS